MPENYKGNTLLWVNTAYLCLEVTGSAISALRCWFGTIPFGG